MLKFDHPLWPYLNPESHGLKKNLESSLTDDASTNVSAILIDWFLRKKKLRFPLYIPM